MPTFAPFVLPRYVFILRIVQVILAVIVLGLTAFPAHVFTRDVGDVHESTAFNLFTPSFTILVLIFFFVTPAHFPKVFNRWAVLALESLTWIFWLVAFALMSDFTRKTSWYGKNTSRLLRKRQNSNLDGAYLYDRPEEESSFSSGSGGYSGYSSGYSSGGSSSGYGSSGSFSSADFGGPITTSGVSGWWAMCATASAVGAVTWIIWTVTLVTVAIAAFKQQGAVTVVESTETGEKYGKTGDVEMNTESVSTTPAPQYAAPAPQYIAPAPVPQPNTHEVQGTVRS